MIGRIQHAEKEGVEFEGTESVTARRGRVSSVDVSVGGLTALAHRG